MYVSVFVLKCLGSQTFLDNVFLSWTAICGSYELPANISDHMPINARVKTDTEKIPKLTCEQVRRTHSDKGYG